jgi:hypothetical protein
MTRRGTKTEEEMALEERGACNEATFLGSGGNLAMDAWTVLAEATANDRRD